MAKQAPNSGKAWTPQADSQLRREVAGSTPPGVISLHLGLTEDAIRSRAGDIDVSLKPTSQSPSGTKK
jgi:hypothetical protein